MNDAKTSVLIVDDHPLVRQGLRKMIEKEADMSVLGEAGDAGEALRVIAQGMPDVIIVDISLETETSGIDLVKALKERYRNIQSLVLSMHDENIYAERALRAGAKGYVTKKEAAAIIIEAIRTVRKGEVFLSSRMSGRIIDKIINAPGDSQGAPHEILSDREFEVYRLIGMGHSTGEIAKKLNLSVNTIESHRRKIKDKLGIIKGSDLVKNAVQWVMTHSH